MLRRSLIYALICILSLTLILAVMMAGLVIHNNYSGEPAGRAEIAERYQRGLDWLLANEQEVMSTHIPALWEMLAKLVDESDNRQLEDLLRRYRDENRSLYAWNPLKFQVYGSGNTNYANVDLHIFTYYNHLFMYGHSCDPLLEQYVSVQEQLDPGFCDKHHPISPACKTHQLMGFLYLRENSCVSRSTVDAAIDSLANDIEMQLTFDFRVVDVYIQRLMLLYESGNEKRIKQRWLNRMLDAQAADGGWDDFMPMIPFAHDSALGIGSKRFAVRKSESNFHATVQAVLVLAYEISRRDSQI